MRFHVAREIRILHAVFNQFSTTHVLLAVHLSSINLCKFCNKTILMKNRFRSNGIHYILYMYNVQPVTDIMIWYFFKELLLSFVADETAVIWSTLICERNMFQWRKKIEIKGSAKLLRSFVRVGFGTLFIYSLSIMSGSIHCGSWRTFS